jgi:murein DD-endopeptidase MepM/ murein hydrolase activator NlpD
MSNGHLFTSLVSNNRAAFFSVVNLPVIEGKLLLMDFTASNPSLTWEVLSTTEKFSAYITQLLEQEQVSFGIGGYNEHRTVYSRSPVFDSANGAEPRRLHLGMDIWGPVNTPVFAVADGFVHSISNNHAYGDYGATIILMHKMDGFEFHSLYGHLSLQDLRELETGQPIQGGSAIAHFGPPQENGQWPPHLHFQLIIDMEGKVGDYTGVCSLSEREGYLANCPDPNIVLQIMQYAKPPLSSRP